ncbi:hypothetical protein [uncultured Bradyrhizobium sp.]|jgi:hypothetical protein|uniref:hypothetical protein n=1 Tax=uncultured Bradyrhizobium sp. TaxID=199684 RepID=UPI0003A175C3|nr:hypothetical protein [uncultured Bradyrhizobium sp.]MDU6372655.1 hypothetical protein [Bradyrhizobium sp.]
MVEPTPSPLELENLLSDPQFARHSAMIGALEWPPQGCQTAPFSSLNALERKAFFCLP